jgi:DNA ligase (NAD+)
VNPVFVDGIELKNFEIRGEIFMTDSDFIKINEKQKEENEKIYANPRNLTAGSIKLLNPKEVAKRPLKIVCYYLFSDEIKLKSQSDNLRIIKELGFFTSDIFAVCKNIDEVLDFIEKWHFKRFDLGYQTDGIVVKLNNLQQQDSLGNVGRSPRWAFAYKFEPETAETILKNITLQVGRTGAITPVAELEPVFLAGSTISRATLHNSDFIAELDLHIGDTVLIEKGGDVIPKVTKAILNKRLESFVKYEFPKTCPCELKSELKKIENEANYYCENPNCPWQIRRRIEHFASKNAMDIPGFGEKVVDKLVSLNYLSDISDIYDLHFHRETLQEIEGWGEKSVEKLLKSIEESKNRPFSKFLFAIGIRFVGEKVAKILSKHFNSIEELKNSKAEELLEINEIGKKIADTIILFFQDENEMKIIDKLLAKNFNLENSTTKLNSLFSNKTFVFTGELKTMTRTEAAKKVEDFGGKETKSVSKKTNFVVAGENPGSKYEKAISLNIPILSEQEFIEMFENF